MNPDQPDGAKDAPDDRRVLPYSSGSSSWKTSDTDRQFWNDLVWGFGGTLAIFFFWSGLLGFIPFYWFSQGIGLQWPRLTFGAATVCAFIGLAVWLRLSRRRRGLLTGIGWALVFGLILAGCFGTIVGLCGHLSLNGGPG